MGYGRVFIALYVDELLMVWKRREVLEMVKRRIQEKLEIKDLGVATFLLGKYWFLDLVLPLIG